MIRVVAAALYDSQGRVLIAERPRGKHMAGRWEFPGGKVTPGEDEREAIVRELAEELGVEVWEAHPFMRLKHAYPDREVELSLWIIVSYAGTPEPRDAQQLKWVPAAELAGEDILEADWPFIEALRNLPVP